MVHIAQSSARPCLFFDEFFLKYIYLLNFPDRLDQRWIRQSIPKMVYPNTM